MKHAEITKRMVQVVNLDPAAEQYDYEVTAGSIKMCREIDNYILMILRSLYC